MDKITVLMIGTGGYGGVYLEELLEQERASVFQIVGVVDPYAGTSKYGQILIDRGTPVYNTVEEFYARQSAQLVFLVSPTYMHAHQAIFCMEHGSDVLCEKPICACPEDAAAMIEARNRTGRHLAIGFQWSYSEGILKLKQDLLNGVYGKIKRFRTIVFYPRNLAYYRRSTGWAGKRKLSDGSWLLDSVASNATAHFLHNMLFLSGPAMDRAAEPKHITAEVYRINPIEMFDSCALRVVTQNDAELLFYSSHAVPQTAERMPDFVIECENGTVVLDQSTGKEIMTGTLSDGTRIEYPAPSQDVMRKLYCMADAVTKGTSLSCIAETALPHLSCIWALAMSYPETPVFAPEFVQYSEEKEQYTITNLEYDLDTCWRNGSLPYEAGFPWAIAPHEIDL